VAAMANLVLVVPRNIAFPADAYTNVSMQEQ
jgi:hypothetical protein